jgi:thioester reductase-like protein
MFSSVGLRLKLVLTNLKRPIVNPDAIASLAARFTRTPPRAPDPSMPFALMGLDSLGTIELAAALEQELGMEVPPDVVADSRDARTLASRLVAIRSNAARTRRPAINSSRCWPTPIPKEIRPVARSTPDRRVTSGLASAGRVLLTGATGFLGSWLAKELLEGGNATLVCLVRPGTVDARERLRVCLEAIGVSASTLDDRVRVIEGDLSDPQLGLERHRFYALAADVDSICHAAADVNWALPYRALRGANVLGTIDLLRIAAARSLPFHFVSSLSVCCSTSAPDVVDEGHDALVHLRGIHLGYAQTKVVSEALVREAGRRGLPITIYRPALIRVTARRAPSIKMIFLRGPCPMRPHGRDPGPRLAARLSARRRHRATDRAPVESTGHLSPVARTAASLARGCAVDAHVRHDVRLVPYHAWLRQLERDTSADGDSAHRFVRCGRSSSIGPATRQASRSRNSTNKGVGQPSAPRGPIGS